MPSDNGVTSSKQNVAHVALQHAALNRGAHGHNFVRVHAAMRLALEDLLHGLQ